MFTGTELDFAILNHSYTPIQTQQPGTETIILDHIHTTEAIFKTLFYSSEERFGLKHLQQHPADHHDQHHHHDHYHRYPYFFSMPQTPTSQVPSPTPPPPSQAPPHKELTALVSPFRTVGQEPFNLLERIFLNAESCLGVRREAFTLESTMALNKEFSKIHTLYDLHTMSVVNSLSWNELVGSIRNKIGKMYTTTSCVEHVRLGLSILFKTPTTSILPLTVKLVYDFHLTIPSSELK